ncbi:MAG TPA: NUDIX domain-containing protein [Flavipsychrobacter sp.]|nr:NUDIX domain-containing protein [Flavipsychrobacter sp.]
MNFIQKIYYNNKPLILTNNSEDYIKQHSIAEGYLTFIGAFSRNFRLALQHLDKIGTLGVVIEDASTDSLHQRLYELYKPIDAGGGVVVNEKDEVLMIYRRGKWDLPKGKKDDNEDIAHCALREVKEETGLQHLEIINKLCDTYHVYSQNRENLLKHTVWYKMRSSSSEILIPQKEENILEVKWVDNKQLSVIVYKSYDAIREVLQNAGFKW